MRASDCLSCAVSLTPEEVFSLIEREVAEEIDPLLDSEDVGDCLAQSRAEILAAVDVCRQVCCARETAMEMCLVLLASEQEWVQKIGFALACGKYASLAI